MRWAVTDRAVKECAMAAFAIEGTDQLLNLDTPRYHGTN